jgi:hypothetical protein
MELTIHDLASDSLIDQLQAETKPSKKDQQIAEIAARILRIETTETRNSDRLDFHECAVWNIRAALEAAYEAGKREREGETR